MACVAHLLIILTFTDKSVMVLRFSIQHHLRCVSTSSYLRRSCAHGRISFSSGVACVRDKSTPTTVFPRHSSAYESVSGLRNDQSASGVILIDVSFQSIALFLHHYSFKELFSSDRPELIKPKDENIPGVSHPLAAYLKGIAILEHTDKLFLILQREWTLTDVGP